MEIGRYGTAQHVEKFVRSYRRARRAEETEHADIQHRERSLTYWYEADGTLVLHGTFPPETALDNLVLLCSVHHHLVHEGGFDVRRFDDGALRFTDPNGSAVRAPSPIEASSPATIVVPNDARGLVIDRETATARWLGKPIDYDHAIMVSMYAWREESRLSGSPQVT